MVPGSFGLIAGIACLILLVSGWGDKLCCELKLSRGSLRIFLLAYVLGNSIMIPGPLRMQISFSGFLLPLFLYLWMIYRTNSWLQKLFLLVKGCMIAVIVTCFNVWMEKGLETVSWQLAWSSESVLVCLALLFTKSWQHRFTTILSATLLLQVFVDIWIRHVPFEHFEFGNRLAMDMLLIGSIQLCFSWTSLVFFHRCRSLKAIVQTDKTPNRT